MQKKKILFLGETYRADAQTWIQGLQQFGDFEVVTWELKTSSDGWYRLKRLWELSKTFFTIRSIARKFNPDMVIAERTTSYGFLAALCGIQPIAIAQQGISDLWPENSLLFYLKKIIQKRAFRKADLIHAWGPVMAQHMIKSGVDMSKVMILPKGINLSIFHYDDSKETQKIEAIVTRSLLPEYKHEVILKAFGMLKEKEIPFNLTIVGQGIQSESLKLLSRKLGINQHVHFAGSIENHQLPPLLQKANIYISTPTTEGVSASLFEAMACGCFPIVTDLPGNRSWIRQHDNGILVPSENSLQLAQEIEFAFTNPELRQKAVLNNRKFVEQHANYEVNMKSIATKYQELIAQQNSKKERL